jgi:hypothetical protein
MSKNYLELRNYFPELFKETEGNFNPLSNEMDKEYEADLQFKPAIEEEEQTV